MTDRASSPPKTEEPKVSAYLEVINKRLRNLRKRLKNMEGKEPPASDVAGVTDFNKRKNEAEMMIAEYEDLLKNMSSIDIEEAKAAKVLQKKQKAQAREKQIESMVQLAKVLYTMEQINSAVVNEHFKQGTNGALTLSEAQLASFQTLRARLYPTFELSTGLNNTSKSVSKTLVAIVDSASEELIASILPLVDEIAKCAYFDPEAAARAKAEAEAAARAAEEAALQAEIRREYVILEKDDVPAYSEESAEQRNGLPKIEFMGESEVLLEEPQQQQQQQQQHQQQQQQQQQSLSAQQHPLHGLIHGHHLTPHHSTSATNGVSPASPGFGPVGAKSSTTTTATKSATTTTTTTTTTAADTTTTSDVGAPAAAAAPATHEFAEAGSTLFDSDFTAQDYILDEDFDEEKLPGADDGWQHRPARRNNRKQQQQQQGQSQGQPQGQGQGGSYRGGNRGGRGGRGRGNFNGNQRGGAARPAGTPRPPMPHAQQPHQNQQQQQPQQQQHQQQQQPRQARQPVAGQA